MLSQTRRDFFAASATGMLATGTLTTGALSPSPLSAAETPARRPRVAVIYTIMRKYSHAQNFMESFLQPYLFSGKIVAPTVDVISLYADQRSPEGDNTDRISREFRIPVYKTIRDALTCGGKSLACDAVLLIGEHGDYPTNSYGQIEYPRKRFFDETVAVMKESQRFVPIFNDKHLSYRWDWSRAMYDTARELGIPLMAGSSVPLAQRIPALQLPPRPEVEEIVSIHGGPPEIYDFHGFEVLQAIIEGRKGGETGIAEVEFLTGEAMEKAAQAGRWSLPLTRAALAVEFGQQLPDWRKPIPGEKVREPHVIRLTYRDGTKATIVKIGQKGTRWNVAVKLRNEKQPRCFRHYPGSWGNRNLFMVLSHAIMNFFCTGRAPYPVERTLLASGVVDAAMHSRKKQQPQATPQLQMTYAAQDFSAFIESGASWPIAAQHPEDDYLQTLGKHGTQANP
ncbi:MAG: hypothetical protein LC104_03990 [Bacteroidales bacterium]|nr:hypothetical protein [Bacteroidales bacterium]